MKRATTQLRTLFQVLAVLVIAASLATANPLTCNTGTQLVCTFWIDIFSGNVTSYDPGAAAATPEAAGFVNNNLALPGWNTTSSTPTLTSNQLTSVSMTLEWAASANVIVENLSASPQSFVNAFASVPLTVSAPGPTIASTTATSAVVSGTVPGETTTPNPTVTYDETNNYNSDYTTRYNNLQTADYNSAYSTCLFFMPGNTSFCSSYASGVQSSDSSADSATAASAAGSDSASDCTARGGTSYDSSSHICSGVPNGSTTAPGNATFPSALQSGSSSTVFAPSVGSFESNGYFNVIAAATSNNSNFGGTETGGSGDLFFGGNAAVGGILEVTYTAQSVSMPEPLTFFLAGGALIGLGLVRRRTSGRRI